jgi:hypothetical protein
MKLPLRISKRQLALPLERETTRQQANEPVRKELIKALADLLLEALGKEVAEPVKSQGVSDEF